jgi:hypothetical protein
VLSLAAWLKQTDSMGTTRLIGCSVHREDRGPALFCSHSRYLIWIRNKSFTKFSDSGRGEQNMDHKNNHDHSVQRLIILWLSEISGYHGREHEDDSLLGYSTM